MPQTLRNFGRWVVVAMSSEVLFGVLIAQGENRGMVSGHARQAPIPKPYFSVFVAHE